MLLKCVRIGNNTRNAHEPIPKANNLHRTTTEKKRWPHYTTATRNKAENHVVCHCNFSYSISFVPLRCLLFGRINDAYDGKYSIKQLLFQLAMRCGQCFSIVNSCPVCHSNSNCEEFLKIYPQIELNKQPTDHPKKGSQNEQIM